MNINVIDIFFTSYYIRYLPCGIVTFLARGNPDKYISATIPE